MSFNTNNISFNVLHKAYCWAKSEGDFTCSSTYNFTTVVDGDPVVKTFDNFTIEKTGIVSVTNKCRGIYLNILGDLTIHGTLSMTGKGVQVANQFVGIDTRYGVFYENEIEELYKMGITDDNIIPKYSYLEGQEIKRRSSGYGGKGGQGGWWSSGGGYTGFGAAGSPGSPFGGGAGGKGANQNSTAYGGAGAVLGGGLIILVVRGNVKISLSGVLESNGVDGIAGNRYFLR